MERILRTFRLIVGLLIVNVISTGVVMLFMDILFENSDHYKVLALSLGGFITLAVIYRFCGEGKNIPYKYKLKKLNLKI